MRNLEISDIKIEVISKNIKNINLSVHPPNGRVRLSVPKSMSDESIRQFAMSKLSWIKKQKKRFESQDIETAKAFKSGEDHYFFGKRYILNIIETKSKQKAEIEDDKYINLYIKKDSTLEKREKIMDEWYRAELKNEIPKIINKWEDVMNVSVNECNVKKMKTRWGTCNVVAKRIWINLELAKKNPRCLEYIVVHEMAHLLERSHNYKFKAYMDKFLPNWRSLKNEINGLTDK